MSENAQQELEQTVADAVREGFRVESQIGTTVVIARRKPISVVWTIVRVIIIIASIPISLTIAGSAVQARQQWLFLVGLIAALVIPILLIVLWIKDATQKTRFQIRIGDDGNVIQEKV